MEIGIQTNNFANKLNHVALAAERYAAIRAAGFNCADLSLAAFTDSPFYESDLSTALALAKEEREIAARAGIRIHQVHGPWPTDDKTAENRAEKLVYMERAIRLTSTLGARYLVIHPDMPFGWDDEPDPAFAYETNRAMFRALLPIAEEEGVILCIENMPMKAHAISRVARMVEFVKDMNHPHLGMCFDTGHANVFGDDCGDAVRLIAPCLKVLHVHDNMGDKDEHLPPFAGTIGWERFSAALKEVGFRGVLSIEANFSTEDMKNASYADAARLMAARARRLANWTE